MASDPTSVTGKAAASSSSKDLLLLSTSVFTPVRSHTCASDAERSVHSQLSINKHSMLTHNSHSVTPVPWPDIVVYTLASAHTSAPTQIARRLSLGERPSRATRTTTLELWKKPLPQLLQPWPRELLWSADLLDLRPMNTPSTTHPCQLPLPMTDQFPSPPQSAWEVFPRCTGTFLRWATLLFRTTFAMICSLARVRRLLSTSSHTWVKPATADLP